MEKLYIAGWQEHQTFRKDRGTPPWIKLHRNLFMKQKWVALSDAEKGHLISMWILAADDDGKIPADAKVLRKLCQLDDVPNIKKFIELQWLSCDDNQMATTCQPDDNQMTPQRREEERREEKKKTVYPDWLDQKAWQEFKDYRKSKKSPLNDLAETKAINALKKLVDEGYNQAEVIDNIIVSSWTGIYPPSKNNKPMQQLAGKKQLKNIMDTL